MKRSRLWGPVLALVLDLPEPAHPYLLATLLTRRLEPALWMDRDAIYRILRRLADAGLVAVGPRDKESGAWQRQWVYWATERTESAVAEWMAAPVSHSTAREDLQMKIAFSRPSDAPVLLGALDAFEAACLDGLQDYESGDEGDETVRIGTWRALTLGSTQKWTEEHLKADLAWIMSVRESIRDYAARQGNPG